MPVVVSVESLRASFEDLGGGCASIGRIRLRVRARVRVVQECENHGFEGSNLPGCEGLRIGEVGRWL